MYALSPSVNRLPITDYFADIGNVSMDALAGVTSRLPITDHRLLTPIAAMSLCMHQRQVRPDYRLPTTDYLPR